ncbi:MAG: hypothetical protein FRX48_00427 [Lasallia pustulata]|uniref:Structure-specific endonuclease subunit SLX4 n=1 Tax=Lasallia pustulata TaxID=136370 RepID=A0A5M8Q3Q8_9LECA|nr:MAG: hypothetical protein FRX48_00427 [Lasallia pustulata]
MATAEVIVLSSSPSRSLIATTPPPGPIALMSSSPRLPSPSQSMMQKRQVLVTGSRATPVPPRALAGFASAASAASLLRTAGTAGLNYNAEVSGKLRLGGQSQIQRGGWGGAELKDLETGQGATKANTKKPRGPRKKAPKDALEASIIPLCPDPVAEANLSKSAAVKKPRARKSKDESQTTIKKGKVTKPATTSDSVQPGKGKCTARKRDAKADVERDGLEATLGGVNRPQDVVPLYLDEATRRRKDWTPPKDTLHMTTDVAALTEVSTLLHDSLQPMIDEAPSRDLSCHLSNYSYTHGHGDAGINPVRPRTSEGTALTKKRRVELIDTLSCPLPPPNPVKRSKVPKKKPQTITEKATAPFMIEDAAAAPTLFQYFPASVLNAEIGNQDTDFTNQEQPSKTVRRKSSAKAPSKAKRKTTASKKQIPKAPILLSPETAQKSASNQDLLFGTSSQLAREESPTLIRDLQQAIKASESIQEPTSMTNSRYSVANAISGSSTGSGTALHVASRNLWLEAARDTQGKLLDVEVVDLLDEGEPPVPLARDHRQSEMRIAVEEERNATIIPPRPELNDFIALPDESELQNPGDPTIVESSLCLQPSISKSVAEAALRQRPRNRSPLKKASRSRAQKDDPTQKPDFQGFTTSKLAKEIASYEFKPIKNREQMITLLEKCWEGKVRMALQSLPPNASVPSQRPINADVASAMALSPPKTKARPAAVKAVPKDVTNGDAPPPKPRGRPRKTIATSVAANSAQKPAPKSATLAAAAGPPRPCTPTKASRKAPTTAPTEEISDSEPLPLTNPHAPQTPHLTPGAAQQHLFSKITEAITTFPPTHDPKRLTWHEKMLMYDPVVLEDLAAWLNTEGLGRVGVDEEVGAGVVRAWF